MSRNTLESENTVIGLACSLLASYIRCLWHTGIAGEEEPDSHALNCTYVPVSFISFQLTLGLHAQSLRWNLGHENMVFSLSASGSTHSWLRLEDIEHITGENTPAEGTYTNTHGNAILLPRGSPDFELWPVTQRKAELNLHTWSMLQLDTAGEVCNVNNLCLLTMLCRIQKPVFKARHCTYHAWSLLPPCCLLKSSYWNVSKSMGSVISFP